MEEYMERRERELRLEYKAFRAGRKSSVFEVQDLWILVAVFVALCLIGLGFWFMF